MINKDKYIADIIIVSYKNAGLTIQCVESIKATVTYPLRIIIVDNASPDDTIKILQDSLTDVEIIENESNCGYSSAVNTGMENSNSAYAIISNNDVIYHQNVIEGLLMTLDNNPAIGAAGPAQQYEDGSWQISHGLLPGLSLGLRKFLLIESVLKTIRRLSWRLIKGQGIIKNVGYIDGACIAVKRKAFEEADGFDEDYFFYSEEADFCHKLQKAGWKTVINPKYVITHRRGGSSMNGHFSSENISSLINSKLLYCRKNLTANETKLYLTFEKMFYKMNVKTLQMLKIFVSYRNYAKYEKKLNIMKDFYNAWMKAEKELRLS